MNRQLLMGLFALITLLTAGAAIGRAVGLSGVAGAYAAVVLCACIGWMYYRWAKTRRGT